MGKGFGVLQGLSEQKKLTVIHTKAFYSWQLFPQITTFQNEKLQWKDENKYL